MDTLSELKELNQALSQDKKIDLLNGFKKAKALAEALDKRYGKALSEANTQMLNKPLNETVEEIEPTEEDFNLDPMSLLPKGEFEKKLPFNFRKDTAFIDEDFNSLLKPKQKKLNEAVQIVKSDLGNLAQDAEKMAVYVTIGAVNEEEANEILVRMVEYLDKAMEKTERLVAEESEMVNATIKWFDHASLEGKVVLPDGREFNLKLNQQDPKEHELVKSLKDGSMVSVELDPDLMDHKMVRLVGPMEKSNEDETMPYASDDKTKKADYAGQGDLGDLGEAPDPSEPKEELVATIYLDKEVPDDLFFRLEKELNHHAPDWGESELSKLLSDKPALNIHSRAYDKANSKGAVDYAVKFLKSHGFKITEIAEGDMGEDIPAPTDSEVENVPVTESMKKVFTYVLSEAVSLRSFLVPNDHQMARWMEKYLIQYWKKIFGVEIEKITGLKFKYDFSTGGGPDHGATASVQMMDKKNDIVINVQFEFEDQEGGALLKSITAYGKDIPETEVSTMEEIANLIQKKLNVAKEDITVPSATSQMGMNTTGAGATGKSTIGVNGEGVEEGKQKYTVKDWAGNYAFDPHGHQGSGHLHGPTHKFGSEEEAEEFLRKKLGNKYDSDKDEYSIVPVKEGVEETFSSVDGTVYEAGGQLDPMVRQYLETALWSSNDESTPQGGEPLDKSYDVSNISKKSVEKAKADCNEFYEQASEALKKAGHDIGKLDLGDLGHNFWLTRNGHGAGFWDGDYEKEVGDILTNVSDSFGEIDPYVSDDGEVVIESVLKVETVSILDEADPSLAPPKKWFDKMYKNVHKGNPDYSDQRVRDTIGSVWYHNLSKGKRKEIRGREGKKYAPAESSQKEIMKVGMGFGMGESLEERKLSYKQKKNLPDSAFVFPKERKYPIHDEAHAKNALARSSGKPEEKKVRAAVYKKYPSLKPKKESIDYLDESISELKSIATALAEAPAMTERFEPSFQIDADDEDDQEKMREFLEKYPTLKEQTIETPTGIQLSPKAKKDLQRTYKFFISQKEAEKRTDGAKAQATEHLKKLAKEYQPEHADKINIEPEYREFDNYVGSDAASISFTVSYGDQEKEFEPEALYYTGAHEGLGDAMLPTGWDWATWLMSDESPFYSEDFREAYASDQASSAMEQFAANLDESDIDRQFQKLLGKFDYSETETEESVSEAGPTGALKKVLAVVNQYEQEGKAHFSRNSNGDMAVWVRDPRMYGGSPNDHWAVANEIDEKIRKAGGRTLGVTPDPQSGNLLIRVSKIYPKSEGVQSEEGGTFCNDKEAYCDQETHNVTELNPQPLPPGKTRIKEEEEDEPQDDDAFISDARGGGVSVSYAEKHLGDFSDQDEAEEALAAAMKKSKFWPNVWWVSDHGNQHLMSKEFYKTHKVEGVEEKLEPLSMQGTFDP